MSLDHDRLVGFLSAVEGELPETITLVAAGGTALVLLNVKRSTIDVDFTGPTESIQTFRQTLDSIPHGFDVDSWPGGNVFTTQLPSDYIERARRPSVADRLDRIELLTLAPVDVVVTKIGRFNERDQADIQKTVGAFDVEAEAVEARADEIDLAANRGVFEHNLEVAVRKIESGWET